MFSFRQRCYRFNQACLQLHKRRFSKPKIQLDKLKYLWEHTVVAVYCVVTLVWILAFIIIIVNVFLNWKLFIFTYAKETNMQIIYRIICILLNLTKTVEGFRLKKKKMLCSFRDEEFLCSWMYGITVTMFLCRTLWASSTR